MKARHRSSPDKDCKSQNKLNSHLSPRLLPASRLLRLRSRLSSSDLPLASSSSPLRLIRRYSLLVACRASPYSPRAAAARLRKPAPPMSSFMSRVLNFFSLFNEALL